MSAWLGAAGPPVAAPAPPPWAVSAVAMNAVARISFGFVATTPSPFRYAPYRNTKDILYLCERQELYAALRGVSTKHQTIASTFRLWPPLAAPGRLWPSLANSRRRS